MYAVFIKALKKVKSMLFKKKKIKFKKDLKIVQNKEQLYIQGTLSNPSYKVTQLWFRSRFTEKVHKIDAYKISNQFEFTIDLNKQKDLFADDEQIYDMYLMVSVFKKNISETKAAKLENKAEIQMDEEENVFYKYPIRLGKFAHTENINLEALEINGKRCILYNTVKGNVSFAVNYEIKPITNVQIDYLKSRKHTVEFGGRLFTKNSKIDSIELAMTGRETSVETKMAVNLSWMKEATEKKYGLNRYEYKVNVDLNEVFQNQSFGDDIYDFYFEIKYHDFDENLRVRIGKPRFKARYYTKASSAIRGSTVFATSPYYTFKGLNLSLQVNSFDHDTYAYLRKIMRWSWLINILSRRKSIWIVGERSYKAQDTGYHFFKYMRENHPQKNVYYVIEKDSPELQNVKPYGNILYYKSKEHIKLVMMATRIIGSHHPDYLYPLRTQEFIKKVKAKKVFLQHGIMGTKNMIANYGREASGFDTDIFMVSSSFEKEMIINDFGYDPSDVIVTGLSRYDSLFENGNKVKRQLLILPTWRDWLVRESSFLESEYFKRYLDLVNSSDLHKVAKEQQFEIVFCLHPNMQKFIQYFIGSPVKVISQGEIDVQSLLKESSMLITDYSSVAFDFSFLEKPIVYYQFDRKRFIGKRGSHLDLDNDLPGDIVYELNDIISLTETYAQSDFQMKKRNKIRAGKFLKYKDRNSSERIYQAVSKKISNKPFYKSFSETELYRTLFKRFRKSKYYFPIMKRFYKIAKKVAPVKENLILFESGVGKQYADSPRCIYEEIVKRNLNYKKVWVCNKTVRFNDPNTIRIKRLSPSYYYYLAKAKIWVNNQNFPTYIEKRPQTTYIQTWHGTPLKKMLFDIENIMGRSDDYLERVSKATRTWDYLISPSPYASKAFQSAFRYEGEILETGYPRNDIFYQEERLAIASKVKSRLDLPKDKKVILYAPTFRDNQATKNNKFTFDINMDLHKLKEQVGDDYIILLRMHVVVSNRIKLDESIRDFVKNVSNYSDIQELLVITDILITDYSSVMFDFANTGRPMLFYTYDLETYRDDVRGFYINFEKEAPGPLLRTTEDIIDSVTNIKKVEKEYKQKYDSFYDTYCLLEDGKASERIVDMLIDK